MRYPKETDPLVVSVRILHPSRLGKKGMGSRMNELTKKCGFRPKLEPGQKRHKVMLDHGMRKYCNTMMRRAKVNFADKEDMQGRNPGGQEGSYERYEEQDFERFSEYQKAIPFLTISDDEKIALENKKLKEEKTILQQKIEETELQKDEVERLRQSVDMLMKERIEKISLN